MAINLYEASLSNRTQTAWLPMININLDQLFSGDA